MSGSRACAREPLNTELYKIELKPNCFAGCGPNKTEREKAT